MASSQEPLMWVLQLMMRALEVTQAPLRLICLGSAGKRKPKIPERLAAETSLLLVPKSMMHHDHLGLSENVGYIPNFNNYSHLIGIMIINHWV